MLSEYSLKFMFLCLQVSEDDKLPRVICLKCTEQLESLHKFKEAARKTEDILRQFLTFTKKIKGTDKVSNHWFIFFRLPSHQRILTISWPLKLMKYQLLVVLRN